MIDLFSAEGVKRFFVWLSPGPNMDVVRRWLEGSGLSRIRRTGLSDAVPRRGFGRAASTTDLEIREVSVEQIEAARDQLGDTLWPEYVRSAGSDGFFHYMAFDGERPVAIAALCVFEEHRTT